MVWKKEGVLFGSVILLVVFFNLNIVEAGVLCADNQIIMRLSSATNAHGEVWNGSGNYSVEICYDRVFGVAGNGNRACSGTNEVVGLSSLTNAHAESPSQTNYPISVCYGNVSCVQRSGACLTGENLTLTLSSATNAHLSNSSSYTTSICCSITGLPPPPPGSCTLTSASWNKNQSAKNQPVTLSVVGTNCSGQAVSFVVKERDTFPGADDDVVTNPVNAVFNSTGIAVSNWIAEYQSDNGWPESDPPEYYFTATVISTGANRQSNELQVYEESPLPCANIVTCGDYGDQQSCINDLCVVAKNSVPSHVDCDAPGTSCFCAWNSSISFCEGAWRVNNPPPEGTGTCYYTQDTSDTCEDDGFLTVSWLTRWQWDDINNPNNDPQSPELLQCQSDNGAQDSLPCPAQIPLPFFGFYNLLAALVLVALVYFAISLRKGKVKKRK